MNYCRKCGFKLKQDNSSCPNCGADLTENEERKNEETKVSKVLKNKKSQKTWIPLVLGIIAIINTILYVIVVVTDHSQHCCTDHGLSYLIFVNVLCGVSLSYLFSIITGIKYLKINNVLSKKSLIGLILGAVATLAMALLILFRYFV